MLLKALSICLVGLSSALVVTSPDLSVLSAEKPQVQLTVFNRGEHRAYVSFEQEQFVCNTKNNRLDCPKPEITPAAELKQKIRFSNSKFILDPGQKRNVFALWDGDLPESLSTYTVWAKDHSAEATKVLQAKHGKNASIKINISTVQKVKFAIAPNKTQSGVPQFTQSGNGLIVKNTGSAPLFLQYFESCGKDQCQDAKTRQWPKTILGNQQANIQLKSGRSLQVRYFDVNGQQWKNGFSTENE